MSSWYLPLTCHFDRCGPLLAVAECLQVSNSVVIFPALDFGAFGLGPSQSAVGNKVGDSALAFGVCPCGHAGCWLLLELSSLSLPIAVFACRCPCLPPALCRVSLSPPLSLARRLKFSLTAASLVHGRPLFPWQVALGRLLPGVAAQYVDVSITG